MRNRLRTLIAGLMLLGPAPAHAAPIFVGGMPEAQGTSSGPEHATALHVWDPGAKNVDEVRFQDAGGAWQRFALCGGPDKVQFARLERGVTLVAWDAGDEIHVRTFDRS